MALKKFEVPLRLLQFVWLLVQCSSCFPGLHPA